MTPVPVLEVDLDALPYLDSLEAVEAVIVAGLLVGGELDALDGQAARLGVDRFDLAFDIVGISSARGERERQRQ